MTLPLPSNGGKFKQGFFNPKNPLKYIGQKPIRYLSSWELKFFRFCDDNSNVVEWASEAVIIPYLSPIDNKIHRYYTDGIIAIKEATGIKKYIVEIKPSAQTKSPVQNRKKHKTMVYETIRYAQNQAKWEAAVKYANKHGYQFIILTEKELDV